MLPKKTSTAVLTAGTISLGIFTEVSGPSGGLLLTDTFIDAFGYSPNVVAALWNDMEVDVPEAQLSHLLMTLYFMKYPTTICTLRMAFGVCATNEAIQSILDAFTHGINESGHVFNNEFQTETTID